MIEAYSVPVVRVVEEAAMADLADGVLMERAASSLARIVARRMRRRHLHAVVGLVGGGNNGGDALFALALLAERGFAASAVVSPSGVHPAGRSAAEAAGVQIVPGADPRWPGLLDDADVVVDGITGIGGRPGLREEARAWVAAIPDRAYVVAVDLPSGADPEGLVPATDAVFADETVTFGVAKPVHLLPATQAACGRVTIADIGLDPSGHLPAVERLTSRDVAQRWPVPTAGDDKYTRGVVGLAVGSTPYPGAAVLSVLGALGAGVGMVRYVGPDSVVSLVHQHAPEVVAGVGRVQAWVVGSGVDPQDGTPAGQEQLRHIATALASDEPVVVDAGALALVGRRTAPTVLTPHAGELAALLTRLGSAAGDAERLSAADVLAAPVEHAQQAADELDAVVLLKGFTTLVVAPRSEARVMRAQSEAPAWLATAGAGDVLGGVLGSLLAAGVDPVDAAAMAAHVHAMAATRANPGGPIRALDVARGVSRVVSRLLTRG